MDGKKKKKKSSRIFQIFQKYLIDLKIQTISTICLLLYEAIFPKTLVFNINIKKTRMYDAHNNFASVSEQEEQP